MRQFSVAGVMKTLVKVLLQQLDSEVKANYIYLIVMINSWV